MSRKYTIEEVREMFKRENCKLISKKYVNNISKLIYKCSCGRIAKISLSNFLQGQRCRKCGIEKLKYSYKEVKEIFKNGGCKLISKKYINSITPLRYQCECENFSQISLNNFLIGGRCKKCGIEKRVKKLKYTYKKVKQIFEKNECELISKEYIKNNIPLIYRCSCGKIAKIRLRKFLSGQKCRKCGIKKESGKNHPCYNPNLTEEERKIGRKFIGYNNWRKNVYTRDYWTCQCCKVKGKKIVAHHIFSYTLYPELRIKLENGITLCEYHHKLFHKTYGNKNNNKTQLNEFLKIYKKELLKVS